MSTQPIVKLLTASGVGSRRNAAALIKQGRVTVNGMVVESFNQPVDAGADTVAVDGKRVTAGGERQVYLMVNKPKGIVSSSRSERGEKTVIDLVPAQYRHVRLYPVGRLDKDSTGLILLTNDGDVTYTLTHPRFEQEKEYLVSIEGKLRTGDRAKLEEGIDLEDGRTSPARVKSTGLAPFNYSVTIHEGKKRQVRRMFASLGYTVLELKRVRFGNLRLVGLREGEVRELTVEETKSIAPAPPGSGNAVRTRDHTRPPL
jgi:23S rRNA pseudouridine2605 synthase